MAKDRDRQTERKQERGRERSQALKEREAYVEQATVRSRDLTMTGNVIPEERRREENTLTPDKFLLIGPTNQKPEGSCAC